MLGIEPRALCVQKPALHHQAQDTLNLASLDLVVNSKVFGGGNFILYMGIFLACTACAPYVCLVPWVARGKYQTLGTGLTDGSELPCGWWESNLDPLEKEPVAHLSTEPFL